MVSNKVNTQSWSKSAQRHDFKDEKWNHAGAGTDQENQNVGETLNTVLNPGMAEEKAKTRKVKSELGKDDFLTLMITQMKNQNPMNPMESHEMAAQLAQFSSLEQLSNVNKNLEGLKAGQDPMTKFQALNLLGKSIQSDTSQIFREVKDTITELRFELPVDAIKGTVKISDEKGETVRTIDYGIMKKGLNKVTWDGNNKDGRPVGPGRFIFTVEAENSANKRVVVKTETKGVITGVNYTPEGPILLVGDQKVKIGDIQRIEDGELKSAQAEKESSRVVLAIPEDGNGNVVPVPALGALPSSVPVKAPAAIPGGAPNGVSEKGPAASNSTNGVSPQASGAMPPIDMNALQTLIKQKMGGKNGS